MYYVLLCISLIIMNMNGTPRSEVIYVHNSFLITVTEAPSHALYETAKKQLRNVITGPFIGTTVRLGTKIFHLNTCFIL